MLSYDGAVKRLGVIRSDLADGMVKAAACAEFDTLASMLVDTIGQWEANDNSVSKAVERLTKKLEELKSERDELLDEVSAEIEDNASLCMKLCEAEKRSEKHSQIVEAVRQVLLLGEGR